MQRSSPSTTSNLVGVPLTESLGKWKRGDAILKTSIRRFNGLETDALVIHDVPAIDSSPHFTRADLYVGCSRAKHLLTLVTNTQECL